MRAAFSSVFHKSGSTSILGKRDNAHNILVGMPSASAANAAAASFAALVAQLSYLSASDIELVRKAYRFADEAHLGQLRKDGQPYITHPIAVATQCTEWKPRPPVTRAPDWLQLLMPAYILNHDNCRANDPRHHYESGPFRRKVY